MVNGNARRSLRTRMVLSLRETHNVRHLAGSDSQSRTFATADGYFTGFHQDVNPTSSGIPVA